MRNALRRRLLAVLVAVAGSLTIVPLSANDDGPGRPEEPQYLLRYKFKVNHFVHYEVTHTMKIVTRKGEAAETVVNNSKTRKHYRVVSVDTTGKEVTAILEPVIDHVEMTAVFNQNPPIVYDSKKPPAPRQFQDVHKTIGRPLARLKVASDGRLLEAVPILPRALQVRVAQQNGPAAAPNDPSKNFLIVFPKGPIRVGESWTDKRLKVSVTVGKSLQQKVTLLRKYRLVSVNEGLAKISLRTKVLRPVKDPGVRAQLIQRTPTGTILFDVNRGLLVSRETTIDKTEIGIFGAGTVMKAASKLTERLVPALEVTRNTDGPNGRPGTSPQ